MKGGQHIHYKRLRKRMKRTLYYGRNDKMDQLTLPLSQFAEDYFDKHAPFDYLDMDFATNLSREGCVSPCSLIVAMIYLDRFRNLNRDKFESSDPADLYMSALLVASKYLNDDGETDYVYNDEWAASAKRPLKHVNQQEIEMLMGIEWKLMVDGVEFYKKLRFIESEVSRKEVMKRGQSGSCSYTELCLLASGLGNSDFLWTAFLQPFFATISLASLVYMTSVLALWMATNSTPTTCPHPDHSFQPPPIPLNFPLFGGQSVEIFGKMDMEDSCRLLGSGFGLPVDFGSYQKWTDDPRSVKISEYEDRNVGIDEHATSFEIGDKLEVSNETDSGNFCSIGLDVLLGKIVEIQTGGAISRGGLFLAEIVT